MCTYVRICQITISIHFFALGKKYCYGSTQGEYCDCDYCKCKHGYGSTGKGHCHWLCGKNRKYLPYSVFPLKRPAGIIFLMAFHLKVTVHKFAGIIRIRVLFEEGSF